MTHTDGASKLISRHKNNGNTNALRKVHVLSGICWYSRLHNARGNNTFEHLFPLNRESPIARFHKKVPFPCEKNNGPWISYNIGLSWMQ